VGWAKLIGGVVSSFCLAFGFAFSVTYYMLINVTTNERINQARYPYLQQYVTLPLLSSARYGQTNRPITTMTTTTTTTQGRE
jgi:hypothetical protein